MPNGKATAVWPPGAATTSAGGGGTPLYPNAWCRLERKGDLFTIYRSDDGVTWTSLGTTTFDEPMPATPFVGPEFAPRKREHHQTNPTAACG